MDRRPYKCKACGNLTRFDVTIVRCTKGFWHQEVNGTLKAVEEETTISETVTAVECRWCGHGNAIVELDEKSGEHPLQIG